MVPFFFFCFLAAIIIVPKYLRYREQARVHETLRMAFERGQPVPPEIVEAMQPRRRLDIDPITYPVADRNQRDLRRGVVWLALGLGCIAMGAALYGGLYNEGGAEATFGGMAAVGAIPACIGLAYMGLWYFGRNTPKV